MNRFEKLYRSIIIDGKKDIPFQDLIYFVEHLGFVGRIRGDHHYYRMDGINKQINLQPEGSKAKPYQIRQVRQIVTEYKLGRNEDE